MVIRGNLTIIATSDLNIEVGDILIVQSESLVKKAKKSH
jgi:hypothetical protein